MVGELGDGESATDGIPQQLAHDLIHLMAHQKMVVETQHILSRCHSDDAIVVVGSDVKLRLDILAIDEELENALLNHDQKDPSKPFERLLERFDILHKSLANTDSAIITERWPQMRAALVRQAALSCFLAQQRNHARPEPFDWGSVCTKAYIKVVDRLIPQVDFDLDALDDEEQMSASKERRNLTDVFKEKHCSVSSIKLRTLLKENKVGTFEKDMKAFTRALDQALLPRPKLLTMYSNDGSDMNVVDMTDGRQVGLQGSTSKPPMRSPARSPVKRSAKRKAVSPMPATEETPPTAQALAKANEGLQQELNDHRPGTVSEALAISERLPPPSSPAAKRAAVEDNSGGPADKRPGRAPSRRSGKSVTRRESRGEQVDFDDSQSVDEPQEARAALGDRPSPAKAAALPSASGKVKAKKRSGPRTRHPWTEEEVKHLKAAVMALGRGKWSLALAQYKFQDCRTAVDLKDKWRNLTKD
ncbi:conserved unknown protein [Ectocarpus siliculosus]|uniref:Uncharacterized protein n=1 Tax=Ectocarpus siliculosus TaxID=2880 RepID=D8LH71_ECTSI|nr:conserved unknown protein [Ectocarpus siliculosus]|eukprot:CBN74290.1 conserved unknown protein [Ectocarpus siliculosus]